MQNIQNESKVGIEKLGLCEFSYKQFYIQNKIQ